MAGKNKYDWDRIIDEMLALIAAGDLPPNTMAASKHFGIPSPTIRAALQRERGILASELASYVVAPGEFDGIRQNKTANTWEINSVHPEIHTIEQLLEYCEVDLDVWMVAGDANTGPVLNAWPTTAKSKKIDLTYSTVEDAKGIEKQQVEGSIYSDGQLISKTNLQVKVRLQRIHPIPVIPVIHPLEIGGGITFPKPKKSKEKIKRVLFLADPQFNFSRNIQTGKLTPTHDRRALDIALQIASREKLDDITWLGDIEDLSEWSTHWVTQPEFYWTTQPSLIETHWWLRAFREAQPDVAIDILEGNHNRFKAAIVSRLLAAYELRAVDELALDPAISLPKLLALHQLNIGFIGGFDNGTSEKWFNDRIMATHKVNTSSTPGASAKKTLDNTNHTTIFGDIHRRELVTQKIETRDGHYTQTAVCPGTMCRIDGSVPGSKKRSQWQQGLAVMEYTDDPEVPPRFDLIEIHEGRAIYQGEVLTARDVDAKMDAFVGEQLGRIGE